MCDTSVGNEPPTRKSIFEVVGVEVSRENYCESRGRYRLWESEVADPKLKELGYVVKGWRTTDSDAFGPLCREATCFKDGCEYRFYYG